MKTGSTSTRSPYWALCANPDTYRIDEAVKELKTDDWLTGGSDLRLGDYVLIWRARGRDGHRGIVSFGKVITDVREIAKENSPYWVNPDDGKQTKDRVEVEYLGATNLPLWTDEHPILKTLSVYRSRGGTVFHLSEAEWLAVLKEAGAKDEPWARGSIAAAEEGDSLALFVPKTGKPVLNKQVGTSQHTDGVRIEAAFHPIFNPPDSAEYVDRGKARLVRVLFNNRVFRAHYRYEGQADTSRHLESIRYGKDLQAEFRRVFPAASGEFAIAMGQDINHFMFTYRADGGVLPDEEESSYPEGKKAYRLHRVLERNPEVVKEAKKRFKESHGGRLFCEACKLDFEATYGIRGKGFIEGHHKKPVSEMKEGDATRVEDIAMLCSNCHRMIHRKPAATVDALAALVSGSRSRNY